jgi:hypothetical protein
MDPTKAIRLAMMVAKGVSSVTDKPLFKKDGGEVDDAQSFLPAHEREANKTKFLEASKIKDRMYHATHGDFDKFQNNFRGVHFLTPDPEFANDFLTNSGQDEHQEGANVMPLLVHAKNPFDYENPKHVSALATKASMGKLAIDQIKNGDWSRIEDRTTLRAIKALGHDGVYVNEGGVKNLGVFDSNQIKSATGNRGTYDLNESDITKATGGVIHKDKGGVVDVDNPLAMMGRPQRRMASKMAVGPQPLTLDAYHGTPHLFPPSADNPLGEFDSSKIGTGEGNQSYGHGHYLSELPKVATNYKNTLALGRNQFEIVHRDTGEPVSSATLGYQNVKDFFDTYAYNLRFDDKENRKKRWKEQKEMLVNDKIPEALQFAENQNIDEQSRRFGKEIADKYQEDVKHLDAAHHLIDKVNAKPVGSVYTVNIPDEHVERMLDWDKPLSEQPYALQSIGKNKDFVQYAERIMERSLPELDGKTLQRIAIGYAEDKSRTGAQGAAKLLKEAGIFGIKYLDAGSRYSNAGTRNFVVFPGNEKHLKILKREADGGAVYKAKGGNVKTEDAQKTIRRALMVARSARGTGGANMADEPPLAQIIKRGQPIFPKTPDPTNEELVAARADTRVGSDIVNQRLNKIVPESSRVVGGQYTPGAPGGGRWSDLPRQVLESPGTGFNVQDHELHDLWQQAVNESSQAAKNAVAHHKIVPTFGASGWDKAMRLPIKDRLWYELSGEKMAENMPDLSAKEHMHFMDLVGATSARAEPGENLERALGVLSQSLRGKPVDVDLTQPSAVRQALSRKGQDSSALPGNKTGHFSDTLALAGGVPTRFPISVNDVWVGRMFGVPDDVMSQNQSLHEPMALYFNKIRDLYNQRHGHEAPFVHQSWNFQAPAWVHLRDPDATVSSGDAYHQVWGKIVKKLQDANVPGIEGNKITREALMHPSFADALRRTTPAFRDAPKATIEFGTKLTPKGERARQLYDLSVQNGDTVSQKDYLNTLVGTMYHSARGKLHPWDRLKRAITGDLSQGSDITRIMHPTKDDPLSVGGTFEGDVSPNIRVPLKGMSDDHIAMFNALAGGPLRQAAMATSKIHAAEIGSEPREGHIRGHSIFVPTLDQIHSDDIRSFAKSLTQAGHDMSYVRHPNGYQFDVLPNFSGDVPTGISEDQLNNSYRQTLEAKHPNAKVIAHDFSSIYTPDSEYGNIRSKLIGGIKNDFIRQARLAGMEDREARRLLKQSVSSSDVPEASRRAWLAHRARIDHLTQAEKQLKAFAQQVEANHSAFIDRAEKRMRLAPKETLDQPLSVSEPEKSTGGIVDRALHLVSHLSRR